MKSQKRYWKQNQFNYTISFYIKKTYLELAFKSKDFLVSV